MATRIRNFKAGDAVRVVLTEPTPQGRRGYTKLTGEPVFVPAIMDRTDLQPNAAGQIEAVGAIDNIWDGMYQVSLTDPDLAVRIFEGLVPELAERKVRVMAAVRIPGVCTKLAVAATEEGIDPVGTFVGVRGGRVRAVRRILEEQVDILAYYDDPEAQIRAALGDNPDAKINVDLDRGVAEVWLPKHQHGPAIGREGINSKLISQLVEVRLDIRTV